ncbi:unnamed protein product [Rotaria sordida]|uniref:Retrotransposon gag domain-containing protein n=1 Tax=Rotaria sordida TaxID=392033 RepID=A0A815IXE3_9BILA|nr:unnamed protein product [Rotaria sordida]CAF3939825.1 unnamed protein product [Rotaria sordida]
MLTRQGALRLTEAEFRRLTNIDIDFPGRTIPFSIVYRPADFIMAEKTVANILSKTLEQTPKYSGKPDQDADEWLKDITATFRMADITEPQALKIIPTFLEGPAKQWFIENNTHLESWNTFKAEFIHTYSSPTVKQLASQRLRTRQQRTDEPVIEYYTDVMKLCKIIDPNMTDVSKLDHLYHGLKPSLMKEVLRQAPRTPSEFFDHARREENLDRLVATSVNPTPGNDNFGISLSSNSSHGSTKIDQPLRFQNSSNIYSSDYSAHFYSPQTPYPRPYHPSMPRYASHPFNSSFNTIPQYQ